MPPHCEPARAGTAPLLDLTAPVVALQRGAKPKPPVSHIAWATGIARRIARFLGHARDSQEEADIVAHGLFTLVRKLEMFVPLPAYQDGDNVHGHFRGWVHISLRAECLREAKRLKGGGTFHTPPDEETDAHGEQRQRVVVEPLPTRRTENGIEEVEVEDYRVREGEPSVDFVAVCRGFQRKRRFDTATGEPVAEPAPPPLSFPEVAPGGWGQLLAAADDSPPL